MLLVDGHAALCHRPRPRVPNKSHAAVASCLLRAHRATTAARRRPTAPLPRPAGRNACKSASGTRCRSAGAPGARCAPPETRPPLPAERCRCGNCKTEAAQPRILDGATAGREAAGRLLVPYYSALMQVTQNNNNTAQLLQGASGPAVTANEEAAPLSDHNSGMVYCAKCSGAVTPP